MWCRCQGFDVEESDRVEELTVFLPTPNLAHRGDSFAGWVVAIGVGAVVVGVGFLARDFRRAGRFLTRTAEQAAAGDPSL